MKLYLEHIGNFEKAEVQFNGITVLTGQNSTGKTTIAKSLYSLFNGYKDIDLKVEEKILSDLETYTRRIFRDIEFQSEFRLRYNSRIFRLISEDIYNNYFAKPHDSSDEYDNQLQEIISDIFVEYVKNFSTEMRQISSFEEDQEQINELQEQRNEQIKNAVLKVLSFEESKYIIKEIIQVLSLDKKVIKKQIINNSVKSNFYGDVGKNIKLNKIPKIKLFIKDTVLEWNDISEKIQYEHIKLNSNTYFIDDPYIIDQINNTRGVGYIEYSDIEYSDNYKTNLKRILEKKTSNLEISILNQLQIESLESVFSEVIGGTIDFESKSLSLNDNDNSEISIFNLATGIKQFLVLKKLIDDAKLTKRDILILDEPEVHLHPNWQLKYAELVVLLQKEMDLTVLVNTHSPYFVEAIAAYTKRYKIEDKCNFYATSLKNGKYIVEDKTNKLNDIYEELSDALRELEKLRLEES